MVLILSGAPELVEGAESKGARSFDLNGSDSRICRKLSAISPACDAINQGSGKHEGRPSVRWLEAPEHRAMTTTDLITSDQGAQRILSRSRMNVFFALWAVAMRCFRAL
jgi:hypothetical protein